MPLERRAAHQDTRCAARRQRHGFDELIRWSHSRAGSHPDRGQPMARWRCGAARPVHALRWRAEIASIHAPENDYRNGGRRATSRSRRRAALASHALNHNFCEAAIACAHLHRPPYMCLGQEDAADLRRALRASESDELLDQAITEAIARKPKGHEFIIVAATRPGCAAPHERDGRLSRPGGGLQASGPAFVSAVLTCARAPPRGARCHGAGEDHRRARRSRLRRLEEQEVAQSVFQISDKKPIGCSSVMSAS